MSTNFNSQRIKLFALLSALLLAGVFIHAQSTFTWTGGGADGYWTTANNWGGTAPASPQSYLNFTNTTRLTSTNNFAAGAGGFQIYFKNGAGGFNLYGSGINFYDYSSVDPNIQNEGAFTNQTINFPVTNANTHVQGTVRILNINSNTTTAQGPLTFNGPIGTPSDGLARALNVWGTNTVTFNGVISDGGSGAPMGVTLGGTGNTVFNATNTYVGQTTVNAGTLSVSSGSIATGSFVKVNTGGALSVFGSGKINGNVQIATNTTATQNASLSGTIAGNLQIDPGSTNVTPSASGLYTSPASGFVQVNLTASIAAGGFITNQGVLNLTGSAAQTLGTLVGPGSDAAGNLGGILDNNTNTKTLTLANGSAFAFYRPAGGIPGTTLQIVGNGSAFIKWFGYNDAAGIAYTNILNGGTWTLANVGQNNSGQHFAGTLTVSNGATVSVTNNLNFIHGTWNIVSNSSVTFNQAGKPLQPGHPSSNIGLNFNVNNTGSLFVGGNGLSLGFAVGTGVANTAAENNSLNIPTGGSVVVTNSLTVGNGAANQAAETNTVTLSGGKLLVTGTLAVGAANNLITNLSPWNPVAPVNVFNWTGGQLSAATITTSNGLVIIGVTNSVPTTFFVTNPAVFNSGNISSTTLTNSAGTLAPGDVGTGGKTTINGNYVQTAGGTLAIDLNGTTAASAFQTAASYDLLAVTGTASLAGSLVVRTNGAAAITGATGFTILTTAANGLSGTFNNLNNNRVTVAGAGGASFRVLFNSASLVLTNYAPLAASFTPLSGTSPAPFTPTFDASASTGAITNYTWTFTDNATMTNVVSSPSPTTGFTFTNGGSYTVRLVITASDGSTATNTTANGAFTVTANPTLAWTGGVSGNWNPTDQNWTNLTSGGLTTLYVDGDPVIFNEAGGAAPTVNLAGPVAPAAVSFSNSATAYVLQGDGKISGSATLSKSLAAPVVIATTNDFTGGTTITGGAVQLGDGAAANGSLGSGAVIDNAQLAFNPVGSQNFTNVISGSGAVVVRNATVTLGGANSFTGGTTISNAATLAISADANLGGGGVTLDNGTLAASGSFTLSNRTVTLNAGGGTLAPANTLTLTNPVLGAGGLTMGGAGVLVLSASNSYAGTTTVGSGVVQVGSGGTSGSLPGAVLLAGGSLNYTRTDTLSPAGTIAGSSAASSITNSSTAAGNTNTLTLAAGINTLGTIRNSAAGTLTLNAAANATNNLAGNLVNSAGTLQLAGGWWSVTNNLNTAGNTFLINGGTINAAGGMASYGATNLNIGSGALLVSGGARFSSVLSNANLSLTGGSFVVSNTTFGVRLGNSSGNNAAQTGYVAFNGVQTGGSFLIASNTTDNAFSLGGYGPVTAAQTASYTLSGGTLTILSGAGSGNGVWLGADSNALATTTFTLAGNGKLFASNIKGAQSAASGAKQVFNFAGGTLTAFAIDTSNLQSSNAPGAYGTLYNNGGTFAPGDLGGAGKTTVTGNFTNLGGTLAIDLGGTTPATALQNGVTNYDFVAVSGATLLGGSLTVTLINGFTPATTDSFTILNSTNGVSGTFTNLLLGNRVPVVGAPDFSFQLVTTTTAVILTNFQLNAPMVGVSPAVTNVVYGNSVTLTADATGVSPLSYQWFDNATNAISGATNATLTLPAPAVGASGNYTVVVTNSYGSATAVAVLVVTPASPAIGLASTANPSGYLGTVAFTATLPADATGSLVFSANGAAFSTNGIVSGSSTSAGIASLPRGTNLITAVYSGDDNYFSSTNTLAQSVTNHPPVVNAVTFLRNAAVNSFKIPVSDLLTNATDADGDSLSVASVSATTNGATVLLAGGFVLYRNTNAVPDQFTYTVNDAFGGTNSATVTINVDFTPLFGQSQLVSTGGGTATLNFAGIPGYNYSVTRSTNLTDWTMIWITNAPSSGVFQFIDISAPTPSAYYRLQFNHP